MSASNAAESASNAADRTAPRDERAPRNGSLPHENFRKSPPSRTFKKPLKPPLLLFDLFVQSEARYADGSSMSAFGGKADIVWTCVMSAFDPKRTLVRIRWTRISARQLNSSILDFCNYWIH